MISDTRLLVIAGPTASGKSNLAIQVAKKLKTVIISADSRQFYHQIPIGTAQVSAEEAKGITHFFQGNLSLDEPMTAGGFASMADELIASFKGKYPTVVVCGGTGLYLNALLNGLDEVPADAEIRKKLNNQLDLNKLELLIEELKEKDPEYAATADLQNPRRVIRALEVIRLTGKPYSYFLQHQQKPRYINSFIVLNPPRDVLYQRIDARVDNMIAAGLEEEVRKVKDFRNYNALKTVGYAEMFSYFDGDYTKEQAIEKIKQHTRNYAKRQLTWFRKVPDAVWLNPLDDDIEQQVMNLTY